ncbi:hypothetical protein DsansV1_C10g0100641 [Dioscorea sansibarensis]
MLRKHQLTALLPTAKDKTGSVKLTYKYHENNKFCSAIIFNIFNEKCAILNIQLFITKVTIES